MILYDRFMLGLVKAHELTLEQFDELIQFETTRISLAEVTAVSINDNIDFSSFINLEELKNLYYPKDYISINEVFKDADKHKSSSTQFMAHPEIYRKNAGAPGDVNPFAKSRSIGKFSVKPDGAHHEDRPKLHRPGMDFDHKTLDKIKKHPKKLSPEEHDKIKKDYSNVQYPDRKFNVQVHGDVRSHLHPESSELRDDHRDHLIKAINHLSQNGHGQNPGEKIDDEKHGKEFNKLNKDKSDYFDHKELDLEPHVRKGANIVNKSPLRHFHIPDVPEHPSNVGKFHDKNDRKNGHYQVSYHYSPKSNTYYIHKINSHNLVDGIEGSDAASYYQNAAQQHTLANKQHMLEAVKLFQQRYLKKLFTTF